MPSYELPEGHHTVMAAAVTPRAAEVIDFACAVFDGRVVDRYDMPDGSVAHAEVQIGDSIVYMGSASEQFPAMPAILTVFVDDVDGTYARALAAGARAESEPKDMFYGYRTGTVWDVGGNRWSITQIVERLTKDEIARRMAAMG